MNENAVRWIGALRSGEYQQGRGVLHTVGSDGREHLYSYLGVACALYAAEHPDYPVQVRGYLGRPSQVRAYGVNGQKTSLPFVVAGWLGIAMSGDEMSDIAQAKICALAEANDTGRTFAEIADTIESEIGLFSEEGEGDS